MLTYSIGVPPTNADKLPNLETVLFQLPNNTQKFISPKDIRDAIFTTWENIIFKETNVSGSSVSYIGIDNTSINSKILIGKKIKSLGINALNNELLNSDIDIFINNTTNTNSTKIGIITGTSSHISNGGFYGPTIEADTVNDINGSYVNLSIKNNTSNNTGNGGDINLESESGYISLNSLLMPKMIDNLDPSKDGYVLRFKWMGGPFAIWEQLDSSNITSISSTGTVSISGSPVIINGTNVNFSDANPTLVPFGGIGAGETFSNVPVTTMIRRMLYPYIAPSVSISISRSILEIGDNISSLSLNYSITRTATQSITSINLLGGFTGALITASSIPNGTTNSSVSPIISSGVLNTTLSWTASSWTMSVTDGTGTSSSSTNLIISLPWYFGSSTFSFTQSNINNILGTNSTTIGRLQPLLSLPATASLAINNKTLFITTAGLNSNSQGFLYFGYPSDYIDLIDIKDNNGYSVFNSFTKFDVPNLSSPLSRWSNRNYKFYILTGSTNSQTPQITSVSPTQSRFDFIFGN